jgi:hypothetical protein
VIAVEVEDDKRAQSFEIGAHHDSSTPHFSPLAPIVGPARAGDQRQPEMASRRVSEYVPNRVPGQPTMEEPMVRQVTHSPDPLGTTTLRKEPAHVMQHLPYS